MLGSKWSGDHAAHEVVGALVDERRHRRVVERHRQELAQAGSIPRHQRGLDADGRIQSGDDVQQGHVGFTG